MAEEVEQVHTLSLDMVSEWEKSFLISFMVETEWSEKQEQKALGVILK